MTTEDHDAPRCLRCGQKHLIHDVAVYDRDGHSLRCQLHEEKFAFVQLTATVEKLTATVCIDCGHVELFLQDTAAARRLYNEKHR